MLSERDILKRIATGDFAFSPLEFRLLGTEFESGDLTCDALIQASWEGFETNFATEIRRYSSERLILEAVRQATYVAKQLDALPLVIAPWLSPDQIGRLERERTSGIDLSGNGIVIVPGRILIVRTGNPNLFPDSRLVKNVYEGSSSLVARALLLKPTFSSVNEVLEEIRSRSGPITQSTVSKALKQLEEDVVVRRENGVIRLVQAEKLLDKLATNFKPPRVLEQIVGKVVGVPSNARGLLSSFSKKIRSHLIVTGASSVEKYATMGREPIVDFYCNTDVPSIRGANAEIDFDSRFPNFRVWRTEDVTPFFDPQTENGVRWASPLQCYLELMSGDKRDKETAEHVSRLILSEQKGYSRRER